MNDATAAYHNPAALVLLKNSQIIPIGTLGYFRTQFTGESTQTSTGITETGSASTHSHYYSPSLYLGVPLSSKVTIGLAMLLNATNRDIDESSILRYVQSSNNIQDYDLVPAIGIKINENFSLGAGLNFSYANLHLRPITGITGSTIADSQSSNQSDGTGVGVDAGFLFRPSLATLVGFNYHSATVYRLSGQSVFEGSPQVTSNSYHFKLHSPARSVFSINHFFTPTIGMIATIQRIQWSILRNINVYGIASQSASQPVIVNASIPYYLRDTWVLTLGGQYRATPQWILRIAGTYNQSPGNSNYQIANGDSFILGASMGYDINKTITIDGGYAHAFIANENINISGRNYLINGVNEGSRDAVSVKLTINLDGIGSHN